MGHKFEIVGQDGVTKAEYHIEGTTVHRRVISPQRSAILDFNREMRKNRDAINPWSFGQAEFNIPVCDIPMLNHLFPHLMDSGHPEYKWAWNKFKRSPASAPYRLIEQKKGVNRG